MSEQTARPVRSDPRIKAAVIEKLAEDCTKWGGNLDRWKAVLERCDLSGNGYEIAREADDLGVSGIDLDLVEILDYAGSYRWSEHDNLVKQWVKDCDPKPQFAVGDRIKCGHGIGTITAIDSPMARYAFVPDGEEARFGNGGGILVAYESAVGNADASKE